MKIGIDAHFLSKISQGTGTYTYQLINAINNINNDSYLYLLNKDDISNSSLFNNNKVKLGKLITNFTPFNVCYGYSQIAYNLKLDVIHMNYLCSIFPIKAKQIVTVHDILFKTHPNFFPNKLHIGINALSYFCLRKADHIIAVSEYTKQQLIKFYPFTKEKTTVIYEAASPCYFHIPEKDLIQHHIRHKYKISKPFILFVGRLAPIKNIERLIHTYIDNQLNKQYNLVVVGKFDKSFPNKQLETILKSEGIIRLENIPDEELNILYNAASLFYFVSHGEGFGLPILEAMSAGCPVLTSNVTACNEIAGDAAIKVSPYNDTEISKALLSILNNNNLREELSIKGLIRAKDFSWEKCAKQTMELYHLMTK